MKDRGKEKTRRVGERVMKEREKGVRWREKRTY